MAILGIGTDIIRVSRIDLFLKRTGAQGKALILSPNELHIKSIKSIAGKFAIKESLFKALGIGFTEGINRLAEIEIKNDNKGKPEIITFGIIDKIIRGLNVNKVDVSMSHDGDYVIAFVVLS